MGFFLKVKCLDLWGILPKKSVTLSSFGNVVPVLKLVTTAVAVVTGDMYVFWLKHGSFCLQVDFYHTDESLTDHLTLVDIAYIYSWRRVRSGDVTSSN